MANHTDVAAAESAGTDRAGAVPPTRSPDDDCVECGGAVVLEEGRGERVCSECGLVVEVDRIDRGPEWRDYDDGGDSNARVGPPITNRQHDRGLSTTIDWRDQDGHGRSLSPDRRAEMRRLRTWDERFRTRDAQGRTLKLALGEIDRMASALSLPTVAREAGCGIFRRALDEGLLPGRSVEAVASACLYAGARRTDIPRSLDEVDAVSRAEHQAISRAYRYVSRELELGLEPTRPRDFVERFTSAIGLPHRVATRAGELLELGREHGIDTGRNPTSMAAAAIYAAALYLDEEVTQDELSAASSVSEATIRKRYRELLAADPEHPLSA